MSGLDRRHFAYRDDLADRSLEGRVAAARFVEGHPAQVVAGLASLRRRPEAASRQDTEVLFGEPVTVFETRDGWAWVQLASDGYVGYVAADQLGPLHVATHKVVAERTFLYPEPDIKSPATAALSLGSVLTVTESVGTLLALASGGFVVARHAAPVDNAEPDFVAVAERLVGIPYLWGGKSTKGLDCSGLVQLAMQAAGLPCPRDSDMQAVGLGAAVAKDTPLRRGDLVFWPGHVGIMVNDVSLLHANGHHMQVVIEPLAEAVDRIAGTGVLVSDVRRLPALGRAQ
ncbi:MAG: NlpC/P60 family protein [Hyphomicrobiaceae bacterium]